MEESKEQSSRDRLIIVIAPNVIFFVTLLFAILIVIQFSLPWLLFPDMNVLQLPRLVELALGLVFGKNNISDWQGYRDSLKPANEFCDRFEQELGSLRCSNIVKSEFGMELDLRKEDDLQKFQEAGATHTCSKVVRTAVRIAADLILEA